MCSLAQRIVLRTITRASSHSFYTRRCLQLQNNKTDEKRKFTTDNNYCKYHFNNSQFYFHIWCNGFTILDTCFIKWVYNFSNDYNNSCKKKRKKQIWLKQAMWKTIRIFKKVWEIESNRNCAILRNKLLTQTLTEKQDKNNCRQQHIKTMLKPVSNRKSVLACFTDCPADNHARQLAQFLYGTLANIKKNLLNSYEPLILILWKKYFSYYWQLHFL